VQPRKIPVACVQLCAHDRSAFTSAWPHVLLRVDEAGSAGAKLIVLPEGTVPGYVLGHDPVPEELLAAAFADLARAAARFGAVVVYGAAKRVDDRTFNAAIAIGPDGTELGYAAKQFLWHFDRRWYAAGETLAPIATPLGKLGILVCADGRIPTIAATLCDRGAELLVMPTAWVTSGRDPHALENAQADYMAAVRARENGVPFIVANKVGIERESVAYCGKSVIYAGDGGALARGSETRDEIVTATVVIDDARRERRHFPAAQVSAAGDALPQRTRIAVTPMHAERALARLAPYAADADADLLLAPSHGTATQTTHDALCIAALASVDAVHEVAGIRVASVSGATLRSPRVLVAPRLAGIDCFVWFADDDPAWHVPFARTRAAELRAFVVVFVDEVRTFVVDPDGVLIAGTFDGFALASFVYDPARTRATLVAPTTDVLVGLRSAEAIAAAGLREATRA